LFGVGLSQQAGNYIRFCRTFAHFPNSFRLIKKILTALKIEALNPMQLASVEAISKNNDVILLSPTGSGKTLAFLLPVLKTLEKDNGNVQALILTPSRELALQIEDVFKSMNTGFKVSCCYGGHKMSIEKNNLNEPPALLVGTPGRILDHIRRENFATDGIHTLILDEFDKSLELGFREEMASIIGTLSSVKKRILTSATKALEIPDFTGISEAFVLDYLSENKVLAGLRCNIVRSDHKDKLSALFQLLCQLGGEQTLVFCNHRDAAQRVSDSLHDSKVVNEYFHGGLEQHIRERVLGKFRNGSCNILICTDLASRGLDIPDIKHVIHYHLPANEEGYIHRNGRTARMNAEGDSYLILSADESVPAYIKEELNIMELPDSRILPPKPQWGTIYIGKGKKDKLNKVDIVGFLMQKGNLQKEDIGLIEVKDFFSYVAVKRTKIRELLRIIRDEKIKNKKTVIEECD
jgi:superfamily II DNA/RNA helicase